MADRSIRGLTNDFSTKGGYTARKVGCLKDMKDLVNSMVVVRQANPSACTGFVNELFEDKMSIKNFEVFRDTKLGNYCDARCSCNARCSCDARCSCNARCSCDVYTPPAPCTCQLRVGVAGCTCLRVSVPSCNCVSRNICSCNAVTVACNCNARTDASAACNCQSRTAGICPCVNVQGDVAYICSCNTRTSCPCNPYAGEPACEIN